MEKIDQIEETIRTKKLIDEKIGLRKFKEKLCNDLLKKVNNFERQAMKLKQESRIEELRKLVDNFQDFMELDPFLK